MISFILYPYFNKTCNSSSLKASAIDPMNDISFDKESGN